MNKFAERLKELRLENSLNQTELGAKLGITQTGIAKWEVGKRNPSIDSLIAISKLFKVSVDYLLGLED